jgi:hypothetical protein
MDPEERFYALGGLAQEAFDLGNPDQARIFAHQLLQEAPQYRNDWNYGNAVFHGNSILGRVALQQGNVSLAKQYLLSTGNTPGSPQLNSFGPNVTLAKELLEKGETPAVLKFLALCRSFWKKDHGKLPFWVHRQEVEAMEERDRKQLFHRIMPDDHEEPPLRGIKTALGVACCGRYTGYR